MLCGLVDLDRNGLSENYFTLPQHKKVPKKMVQKKHTCEMNVDFVKEKTALFFFPTSGSNLMQQMLSAIGFMFYYYLRCRKRQIIFRKSLKLLICRLFLCFFLFFSHMPDLSKTVLA